MVVTFEGITYPCKYTVLAENKLCEHFGSVENIANTLDNGDVGTKFNGIVHLLAALIAGGVQREKQKALLLGNEYTGPEAIPADVLAALCTPGELLPMMDDVMSEIRGGYSTTISVEEPKGKNGKATLSK